MVQLTGTKKIRCAVFISGTGSNLKSLIQFTKKKKSPISIELVNVVLLPQVLSIFLLER